ncbi:Zn-dependent amino- or carboxypeptidase, M28 family [Halalkaliarchaeum sp. AArc-CO]|uniref:M28 family metallopeptidase n=1 Tax=unclassified Halalkaliarchaeum TaxID=2678344 RepID=UPI00217D347B|nr:MULTISPECIES: M28 family metallopeptidase [unclassified Halalkaliarchaeum]MDR5671910.1 M28 family metallopeptidase [Halalkaliarchaeum sp. AArc-GB]UWG51415.1 Zn-dependent amino- or carboxypeptidase, M28 family [Halalkaliarchaeum sp. AArc-CO]
MDDFDDADASWIGRTFTSDAGWQLLEELVAIPDRMAGTSGEREALARTRDALEAVGARDARIEPFDVQGWTRGDSRLLADDGEVPPRRDQIALPRSPAGSATGELVDLDYGVPSDFEERSAEIEDSVVMVSTTVPDDYDRFIHRREKYYYAVEHGASAFLFANHVEGGLPPTGSVGSDESPIGEIPAMGVSKELGARLSRERVGESITVEVDAEIAPAESGNVVAELGPETDEEVVVSSHVDAHDIADGAMDNGAGTATVVEIARALAERVDELDTRVRFRCFGAEEVGLVGSSLTADRVDLDAIRAIVNVDSNVAARTLKLDYHGFDELEAAAQTVAERFDHPVRLSDSPVPHSDHWPFVREGVPGYMVSGATEGRDRGWGHTHADTLEKLEPRNLREQAILLTELTVELADETTEPARRDPAEIAADLEAEGAAEGMKVTGDWPFEE